MARVFAGTLLGQLITFSFTPVLLSRYPPEAFGESTAALGIALTAAIAASLRLDLAVPIPIDDLEAKRLATIGVFLALTTTGISMVAVGALVARDQLPSWALLCPVISLSVATLQVLNAYSLRIGDFRPVATRPVYQAAVAGSVQLIWAILFSASTFGLLAGFAVGQAATILFNAKRFAQLLTSLSFAQSVTLLKTHSRFPMYLMPAGVLNTFSVQAPVILTTALFGSSTGGQLALAVRLLGLPVSLVMSSVSSVFVSEAACLVRQANYSALKRLYRRYSGLLLALSMAFLVAALTTGPMAISFLFGSAWSRAGDFLLIMSIAVAAQLIVSPVSQSLILMGRSRSQLAFDSGRLAAILIVLGFGYLAGHPFDVALMAMSVSLAAFYALHWLLGRHAIRTSIKDHEARTDACASNAHEHNKSAAHTPDAPAPAHEPRTSETPRAE
jgi:O-antigen/teichoic acid export membrane protein